MHTALPTARLLGIELSMQIGRFTAILSGVLLVVAAFAKDEADQPAVVSKVEAAYPAELVGSKVSGKVVIGFTVDEEGKVRDARVMTSTNHAFEKPALDAIRQWRFEPGVRNGRRIKTKMLLPIMFSLEQDGTGATGATNARATDTEATLPIPIESPLPVYPSALLKAGISGTLVSQVLVTREGTVAGAIVMGSPDKRLDEQALAALRRWKFKPAVLDGEAVTAACIVPIEVQGATLAVGTITPPRNPETGPRVLYVATPRYPFSLMRAGIGGGVITRFFVDETGRVVGEVATKATHKEFAKETVDAIRLWRFAPAVVDGRPVPVAVSQEISFGRGVRISAARSEGEVWFEKNALWYDTPPKAAKVVRAAHPYERAIAGEDGAATIKIVVGPDGVVEQTRIVSASAPEFGMSMAAAVETWTFEPAIADKKPTQGTIDMRFVFKAGGPDSPIDVATSDLVERIRDETFVPAKAGDLDAKLRPISSSMPTYPTAHMAMRPAGTAKIEVIVDTTGRAVLPRIVEASEPEFGWAAATAAQRWRFEPPTIGGKPVEVRVVMPFSFAPPRKPPNQ